MSESNLLAATACKPFSYQQLVLYRNTLNHIAQSAWAVEYTDCFSTEE